MAQITSSHYPIPQPAAIDRLPYQDRTETHFVPDFARLAHLAFGMSAEQFQNEQHYNPSRPLFFTPDETYAIRLLTNPNAIDDIAEEFWPETRNPHDDDRGHTARFELECCEVLIGRGAILAKHKTIPTKLSSPLHSFDDDGKLCMRSYAIQDQDNRWPEKDQKELADWLGNLLLRIVADFHVCPTGNMPRFFAHDEKLTAQQEALQLRESLKKTRRKNPTTQQKPL